MSWLRRLLGWGEERREAAGQPPAPPHAPPAAIPVLTVGEAPGASLATLLRAAGFGDADAWARHLAAPMARHAIQGPRRVAAFLSTVAHESNGGRQLEENLSYSADRIIELSQRSRPGTRWRDAFPTRAAAEAVARNPPALAAALYDNRMGNRAPGDGWLYRGRGLIQLTGANNYRDAAAALSLPLLTAPHLAAEPPHAAQIAAWWWQDRGCNELADLGEIEPWRRRVNGGLKGLDDVRRRYYAVLAAMGDARLSA